MRDAVALGVFVCMAKIAVLGNPGKKVKMPDAQKALQITQK